ncbi:MAG TPA: Sua5/YciO/YrdC/YwlC family protein [Tepidisphaeraceae bacterium]|nr:Sua5/YciO/YrdC/YwlC family protein [Tepidisphaeraceae bacterium]
MSLTVQNIFKLPDPQEVLEAAGRTLASGALVVLPTETVYGAAARLDHPDSLRRLRAARGPVNGAFTIHVASAAQASNYLGEVSALGRRMMHKLWPGPVAITFDVAKDRREEITKKIGLTEGDLFTDGRITLRCPDHFAATAVLSEVNGPVALTRVDTASGDRPFTDPILSSLPADVELVIDSGPTRFAKPSTIVRVDGNQFSIVREGVWDQRIIEKQLQSLVLFVCSGNTCRSPMAAALARVHLARALGTTPSHIESKGITVASAGTFAMPGLKATPQAVEAVAEFGGDLSGHRSQLLTHELINAADVIVVMGQSHRMGVEAMSPNAESKIVSLDPEGEVEDPIGGDIDVYRDLVARFRELVANRLDETVLKERGVVGGGGK